MRFDTATGDADHTVTSCGYVAGCSGCTPMPLSTTDARALAAQYQSPGAVGATLAAFASGRRVRF